MKIIKSDNFNRENVSERLVAESVPPVYANIIADLLNDRFSGSQSEAFFRAEKDDYQLYVFEP